MLDWQRIDAVIFDMDGTLVDSMYYWHHLPAQWFERRSIAVPEDLDERLGSADLMQAARLFATEFAPDEQPEAIFEELQQKIDYHYAHDIPLMPGTREFLEQLRQLGKKLCIATMTDRPQVETVLRTHQLKGCFDFLLTTPEVGCGKERPEIFLQACRQFGAEPARVAVFEDSRVAGKTALGLGMPVVILKAAGLDYQELEQLAAEKQGELWFIKNYYELL